MVGGGDRRCGDAGLVDTLLHDVEGGPGHDGSEPLFAIDLEERLSDPRAGPCGLRVGDAGPDAAYEARKPEQSV